MGKSNQGSGDDPTITITAGGESATTSASKLSEAAKAAKAVAGEPAPVLGNTGLAPEVLRAYVERIERLEEEKKDLAADIREVYAEAKGNGFVPKIIRKIVKLRAMDPADRQEEDELLDLYRRAMGMAPFDGTPLGETVGSA